MTNTEPFNPRISARVGAQGIKSGKNVVVRGEALSGKTTLLREITDLLANDGLHTHQISGVASLREFPLAQLDQLALPEPQHRRATPIGNAAAGLEQIATHAATVFVIDDIEHLDDATHGAIIAAARAKRASILASTGTQNERLPWRLSGFLQLHSGPVSLEFMERALIEHAAAPFEYDSMARIFQASGGLIGLAAQIVDAGVFSGGLARSANGAWKFSGELWSDALLPTVEAWLRPLPREERAAVELLATLGPIELEDAVEIVPRDLLRLCEARGLVRVREANARAYVSVFPPLISTALHNGTGAIARAHMSMNAVQGLNAVRSKHESNSARERPSSTEPWHIDVQLFHERLIARLVRARLTWSEAPSPRNAIDYLRALMQAPSSRDEIEQLLRRIDFVNAEPQEVAELACMRAEWCALGLNDWSLAEQALECEPRESGPLKLLRIATRRRLRTILQGVPQDEWSVHIPDETPAHIASACWESQLYVSVTTGDLAEARRILEMIRERSSIEVGSRAHALEAYLLLLEGEFSAALSAAEEGFAVSAGGVDPTPLFKYGCLGALACVFAGDYTRAAQILSQLFALGDAAPVLAHLTLAARVLSVFTAIRTAKTDAARRYLRGVERLHIDIGPMLGQSRAIAAAQVLAYDGLESEAADLIWSEGERSLKRGYVVVAAQQFLMSAEIAMTPERLATLRTVMSRVGGAFLGTYFRYLEAREQEDWEEIIRLAPKLASTGRPGLAVHALEALLAGSQDEGSAVARSARRVRDSILAEHRGFRIDTARLLTKSVSLTAREWEIAHLVAEELSNPDIATRLVVSVRTVESHLTRILRKSGARDRAELIAFVNAQGE